MATGPLRFRTPHIDELPTVHTRQTPGFAWVTVSNSGGGGAGIDGVGSGGTTTTATTTATNRKRARNAAGLPQTDSQREALSARQQRDIDRRIRDLNADGTRDVPIPAAAAAAMAAAAAGRAGKTPNTKKILASGKTFAHFLDDEEAEMARNGGRRELELDWSAPSAPHPTLAAASTAAASQQRPSKTPIARRKPGLKGESGPAATSASTPTPIPALRTAISSSFPVDAAADALDPAIPPLPSQAEMEVLLNAPPLSYNQARSAPPPPDAAPPRRFCEICGYWGRVKCMKCGNMTCSVHCKDAHDEHRCMKFYA